MDYFTARKRPNQHAIKTIPQRRKGKIAKQQSENDSEKNCKANSHKHKMVHFIVLRRLKLTAGPGRRMLNPDTADVKNVNANTIRYRLNSRHYNQRRMLF